MDLDGVYFENADSRGAMQALVPLGVRSAALLPLVGARGNLGLLAVAAERTTEFSASRRALLQAVRAELTTALERYELANAVEESRTLAESVIREMQDGAIVLDTEGRCVVCNPAASRLLGIDPLACRGCPVDEWMPLPAAGIDRLRRSAQGAIDESGDALFDVAGRLLAFTAGPLAEPDGGRRGVIVLIRDVTETVAAERLKQDFISMVGHELRTPLTLIRTSIDLLTEEAAGSLTPTQHRITDVLHNNSDRLLRLINDLLDMSALDSGRMRVHEMPVPLEFVIDAVLPNYAQEAAEREITITVDPAARDVTVWADRARIEQVLANLIQNAMKYTPSGGHIAIHVAPEAPLVRIEVQDNGIGILPSEQELLFQKFQRTTAGERQSGGTGLGLAIARSIVELHGGKIWCESDGRSGSTFSFTLPPHLHRPGNSSGRRARPRLGDS
jgi:PAS domain S-box-containing protein